MTETYRFYPPQRTVGTNELLDEDWRNQIHMRSGILSVTFSCKECGRKIGQSLDKVLPPIS